MPNTTVTALPLGGKETYLGDGLFVSFDGFQIILRAPREYADSIVALEPEVYQSLQKWLEQYPGLKAHMLNA